MAQLIAKKFNVKPLPKSDQEFSVAAAKQLRILKEIAVYSFKSTLKLKFDSTTDILPGKRCHINGICLAMVVKSWMFLMTGLR